MDSSKLLLAIRAGVVDINTMTAEQLREAMQNFNPTFAKKPVIRVPKMKINLN